MDLNRYTERSRGFLQAAQTLASRKHHQRLTPEHLLKVLLDDEEGLARTLGPPVSDALHSCYYWLSRTMRDANHPSIILWSNGNEGGHNKELVDDYAIYDHSNRPVIHAHHRPGNELNGIDCNHYEDYYSTKSLLEGPNIYMPTEFLHDFAGKPGPTAEVSRVAHRSLLSR